MTPMQKLCDAALTIYDAADELMQSDANEPLAGDVQMLRDTPVTAFNYSRH